MRKEANWQTVPLPASLGPFLAELRGGHALSQSRAASLCGLDNSLWSRLEGGQRGATPWVVGRIAGGFNLDLPEADALRVAAGYWPEDAEGLLGRTVARLLAEERGLATLYRLLTDDGIDASVKLGIRGAVAGLADAVVGLVRGPGAGRTAGPLPGPAIGGGSSPTAGGRPAPPPGGQR